MIAGPGTATYNPQTWRITAAYVEGDCLGYRDVEHELAPAACRWDHESQEEFGRRLDEILAGNGFVRTGPWADWTAPIAPAPRPPAELADEGPWAIPNVWDVSP
jgi:hypothetical protein